MLGFTVFFSSHQQLEQEQLELREEMSEKEKKHELLKSDMEKDIKLMLKEIAKLRNKLKDKAGQDLQVSRVIKGAKNG